MSRQPSSLTALYAAQNETSDLGALEATVARRRQNTAAATAQSALPAWLRTAQSGVGTLRMLGSDGGVAASPLAALEPPTATVDGDNEDVGAVDGGGDNDGGAPPLSEGEALLQAAAADSFAAQVAARGLRRTGSMLIARPDDGDGMGAHNGPGGGGLHERATTTPGGSMMHPDPSPFFQRTGMITYERRPYSPPPPPPLADDGAEGGIAAGGGNGAAAAARSPKTMLRARRARQRASGRGRRRQRGARSARRRGGRKKDDEGSSRGADRSPASSPSRGPLPGHACAHCARERAHRRRHGRGEGRQQECTHGQHGGQQDRAPSPSSPPPPGRGLGDGFLGEGEGEDVADYAGTYEVLGRMITIGPPGDNGSGGGSSPGGNSAVALLEDRSSSAGSRSPERAPPDSPDAAALAVQQAQAVVVAAAPTPAFRPVALIPYRRAAGAVPGTPGGPAAENGGAVAISVGGGGGGAGRAASPAPASFAERVAWARAEQRRRRGGGGSAVARVPPSVARVATAPTMTKEARGGRRGGRGRGGRGGGGRRGRGRGRARGQGKGGVTRKAAAAPKVPGWVAARLAAGSSSLVRIGRRV